METNITITMGLAVGAFFVNLVATVVTVAIMIGKFASSVNVSIAVLQRDVATMVTNHVTREEWMGYKAEREARLAPMVSDLAAMQGLVTKLQDRQVELATQMMLVAARNAPPHSTGTG